MEQSDRDLITMTANEVVNLLKKNEVSPMELLSALEKRVNAIDKDVNALPTRCFSRAKSEAEKVMQKPLEERGLLAGLPIAIKDLAPVQGVKSTWGSPVYLSLIHI